MDINDYFDAYKGMSLDESLNAEYDRWLFKRNLRRGDEKKRAIALIALGMAIKSDSPLFKGAVFANYRGR